MSNNAGNTLVAVLTGVAIGAGIGILFAPDKGSKTRMKIKEGFDDVKDDLHYKFDKVSSQLSDKLTIAKAPAIEQNNKTILRQIKINTNLSIMVVDFIATLKPHNL